MDDTNKTKLFEFKFGYISPLLVKAFVFSLVLSAFIPFISAVPSIFSLSVVFYFFYSISAGAMFILALSYLLKAQWLIPLRCLFLNIASAGLIFLPMLIVLIVIHLFTNMPIHFNAFWGRTICCILPLIAAVLFMWSVLRFRKLFSVSMNQNTFSSHILSHSILTIFIIAFSITTFAFCHIMRLQDNWFSGIFPLYHFTASVQAVLACMLLILLLNKSDYDIIKTLTDKHFNNLKTLIFAFTLLHAYTSYFQYVIVYSANIPHDLIYYKHISEYPYIYIYWVVISFRLVIPFIALLFTRLNTNHIIIFSVCILIVLSHFCEILLNVLPFSNKSYHLITLFATALVIINVILFILIYLNLSKCFEINSPEKVNTNNP